MEFNCANSNQQESLISELTQGFQLATKLKDQMSAEIGETRGMLAERIYSCFQRALLILQWGGGSRETFKHNLVGSSTMPESPLSVIGSPKSEDFSPGNHTPKDSRKRKMLPTWTAQKRASSEAGEGVPEDGFSWRKYGQKDILGAKNPRSYYRCTYRNIQGCVATKQVQRNDEDPMIFDITYKGKHTCTLTPRSKSAPTSPQKQVSEKQNNFPVTQYQQQQQPDLLLNFQTGLKVEIQNLDNQDTGFIFPTSELTYENYLFMPSTLDDSQLYNGYAQTIMPSPATSESTYFSTSPCNISAFGGIHCGHHSESDIGEIISAATSGTNSPIMGIDFPSNLYEVCNPYFPFDNQAFTNTFSQTKE
ncbi:probable WRKY transcription factor 53 [Amaranthus tricolor]|uniref:probable WRKY transcription factor 53 n=1 Tax=Amaranthus tricolor TaxID=29722 RepID=UPI00258787E1|nr:probable WRKY transcription factor 53 [Amaranthus tricolor]